MQMNMIFTDHPFQNLNVQHITRLAQQVTTTQLDITSQYLVPILGAPHQMDLQVVDGVTARALLLHEAKLPERSSN